MRRAAIAAMCVLLAACAASPPAPVPEEEPALSDSERWARHAARVARLENWNARGKVAFRLPDEAGSASLLWRRDALGSQVRLSGPLGSNAVTLRSEGGLLFVTRDGIERGYPADAAPWLGDGRLLPIPIGAIEYWLRGIPDPARELGQLHTEDGLARALSQAGWEVSYEDYAETDGVQLPSALTVYAAAVDLRLRVLVRDWQLD